MEKVLELRDPKTQQLLMWGRDLTSKDNTFYIPREILGRPGEERIVFQALPFGTKKPPLLQRVWSTFRLGSALELLPATLVPIFSAGPISWFWLILSLVGVLSLRLSINLLDDVEGHLRLYDIRQGSGSGVLQRGWFAAGTLRRWAIFYLFVALVVAGSLILTRDGWLLVFIITGLIGALMYTQIPVPFKAGKVGEWIVFACTGPLLSLGVALAAKNVFHWSDLFWGLCFGAVNGTVLKIRNLSKTGFFKKDRYWVGWGMLLWHVPLLGAVQLAGQRLMFSGLVTVVSLIACYRWFWLPIKALTSPYSPGLESYSKQARNFSYIYMATLILVLGLIKVI